MKKRCGWMLLGAAVVLAGCMMPDAAEKLSAKQKIKDGALVIDVRAPRDFKAGHVAGATNIPLDEVEKRCSDLGDLNRPIVVYCVLGVAAGKAKKELQARGFTDVSNAGGYSDLRP